MKKYFIFLSLIVLVALMNRAFGAFLCEADFCYKASPFYKSNSGSEGYIQGSKLRVFQQDITLEPSLVFYPYLLKIFGSFDNKMFFFNNAFETNSRPIQLIIWPWFTYETGLYEKHPQLSNTFLLIFIWLLNLPYWLMLAFVAKKLWLHTKSWGKVIVSVLFIDKIFFLILFLIP